MPVSALFEVAKGGFSALKGQVDHAARARIGDLARLLSSVEGRVTTAEGDITAVEGDVTALDGRIDDLETVHGALCQVTSTGQSLTNNTITELLFDTDGTGVEDLDPLGWHENTTNPGRITPTIAGWYRVTGAALFSSDNDITSVLFFIRKNGLDFAHRGGLNLTTSAGAVSTGVVATTGLVFMNGSTDYLTLIARHVNTSAGAETIDAVFTVKLEYLP
jgi:hypothetical protein